MLGHYSTWSAEWHRKNPNWLLGNQHPDNPFNPGPEVASSSQETPKMLGTFQRDLKAYVARVAKAFNDNKTARALEPVEPVIRVNEGVTGGWEGRSDDAPFKRYIVFEVGGIVEAAAFKGWALETGQQFKSLMGSWKGRHNPSFIMEDTPTVRMEIAYWLKGQEAVLCLGPAYRKREDGLYQLFGNRPAILDYLEPDGYSVVKREAVEGLWQAVSKETALRLDGWTFDPTERQYYAVV
jgi:hypothetical protein